MDEMDDKHFAAQIQELQEKLARSDHLDVEAYGNEIKIEFYTPGEEDLPAEITFDAAQNQQVFDQTIIAIGEILAQGHTQLQHFRLDNFDCQNNGYLQLWRGLAANQALKKVQLFHVTFPNEPDGTGFLANTALESLDMIGCVLSHGTFDSLCRGIQSSHISKLIFNVRNLSPEVPLSSLWSALEHGATRLESVNFWFSNNVPRDIETGFESFLTNNTSIQSMSLYSFRRGRDGLPFFVALGRGLAVNTTVNILNLDFSRRTSGRATIGEQLIQTVFAEGLDHNMAIKSLKVNMKFSPEGVKFLAEGLERMMRNRSSAATRDGRDEEESLPFLKELELQCADNSGQSRLAVDAARDLFFDRLSQSDVIRVETVKVDLPHWRQKLSPKVNDFIRSTQVTKILVLNARYRKPADDAFADLADAIEANKSISEVTVEDEQFHKMTKLLSTPNKYRIRCQCRRNEIQVHTLRKDKNLSLLPLVLARLLPMNESSTDEYERRHIEARQLVDRTIAFEMLKDIPGLFAVHGKRKRED